MKPELTKKIRKEVVTKAGEYTAKGLLKSAKIYTNLHKKDSK